MRVHGGICRYVLVRVTLHGTTTRFTYASVEVCPVCALSDVSVYLFRHECEVGKEQ